MLEPSEFAEVEILFIVELISIKMLFFLDCKEYFYKIEFTERNHQLMKSVYHHLRYLKFPNARIVYHHPKVLKLPGEFSCSFNIYSITQKKLATKLY